MFRIDSGLKVFLHREAVDGRKNINGLALLVEQGLGLDPFAQAAYVFSNRRRDRIKILLWDRNGFWLLLKRLESDRFKWPKDSDLVELTVEQLHWLLEGINLSAMQPPDLRRFALITRASRSWPARPARQRLLSGSCSSARSFAPRFLPTFSHPHAVALRFVRRDQLTVGLAPTRVRPCWAHKKKTGAEAPVSMHN